MLNEVAMFLFFRACYEQVLLFLTVVYEKNPDNPDTLYNMAFVLYAFGERDMALGFIGRIKKLSMRELQLQQAITKNEELPLWITGFVEEMQKLPQLTKTQQLEKVAFIVCVDNERLYKECCLYIRRLMVPEGYSVEMVSVYHAKSISGSTGVRWCISCYIKGY